MKWTVYVLWVLSLIAFGETLDGYHSSYAFLNVRNKDNDISETFCVNYQQWQLRQLPAQLNEAKALGFAWWAQDWNMDICLRPNSTANYSGKVVPGLYRFYPNETHTCPAVLQGDDAFKEYTTWQAREADKHQSSALLLLVQRGLHYLNIGDDYLFSHFATYPFNASSVGVQIFFTYYETFVDKIVLVGGGPLQSLELRFYRPPSAVLDGSLFAIFFMALFCIIVGGLWSGHTRKTIWLTEARDAADISVTAEKETVARAAAGNDANKVGDAQLHADGVIVNAPAPASVNETAADGPKPSGDTEPAAQPVSAANVLYFIVTPVATILLLYFSYAYFIWVMIVLYVFVSTIATYTCLSEAVVQLNQCLGWELVPCVRHMLIFVAAATLSICWAVFRKWAFAFILHDILSIFLSIFVIKMLRCSNLKFLTFLLGGFLIYDLFMVFITPYLTADGCSVMLQIMTGGTSCASVESRNSSGYPLPPVWQETFPFLFKFPLMNDPMLQCYDLSIDLQYPMALLGFGDVILPGFLVAYCFAIDYIYKTDFLYGTVCCLGYAIGLLLTDAVLLLMDSAQPALIYLVPCSWIPVAITALIKGQFGVLWNGTMPSRAEVTGIIFAPTATTNLDEPDNQPTVPQ